VLVVSTPAAAAPWSDWVGEYRGTLLWRKCTAAGEKAAAIALDAVDGAMRIDLAPAGAALKTMSLTQDDAAWVAQDGDLHVRVTRGKPNTIVLAIDYDSGCTMRATLSRVAMKAPACDRLLAWARVEDRCTKPGDRIEDFLAVAKTKWKASDAAACRARADKLELALIDRGCAPNPDPDVGTRAVQCRALVDATTKLKRCGRVPAATTQRLVNAASALSGASQSASKAELPYVEQQCKDLHAEVVAIATQSQCQL
jgi:hypothetical protein